MFEQDIVTRLILSIKRVKEPRFSFEVFRTHNGKAFTLVITLFSWRARVGEAALPLLWWLAISIAGYFGFRL